MSVRQAATTATLRPLARTPMAVSPVLATVGTLETASRVVMTSTSVPQAPTNVTPMRSVRTILEAMTVHARKVTCRSALLMVTSVRISMSVPDKLTIVTATQHAKISREASNALVIMVSTEMAWTVSQIS